jgi:ABC-type uncharacterized transport system fused permease/ATPase subunit
LQVSADGEEVLYKACMEAGITMLSIGHRPALRKYHQMIVHFDGSQVGKGWRLEELPPILQIESSPAESNVFA